jgi:hypothetical protein
MRTKKSAVTSHNIRSDPGSYFGWPGPVKSASRNVVFCSFCRMRGCDFGAGSTIAPPLNLKTEGCLGLKKWQGLIAHNSE